jgi:hypothetical protein
MDARGMQTCFKCKCNGIDTTKYVVSKIQLSSPVSESLDM